MTFLTEEQKHDMVNEVGLTLGINCPILCMEKVENAPEDVEPDVPPGGVVLLFLLELKQLPKFYWRMSKVREVALKYVGDRKLFLRSGSKVQWMKKLDEALDVHKTS